MWATVPHHRSWSGCPLHYPPLGQIVTSPHNRHPASIQIIISTENKLSKGASPKTHHGNVPLVVFKYLVFTCMQCDSYCRWFRLPLLCPLWCLSSQLPLFVDSTHVLWSSFCFKLLQTSLQQHGIVWKSPQSKPPSNTCHNSIIYRPSHSK